MPKTFEFHSVKSVPSAVLRLTCFAHSRLTLPLVLFLREETGQGITEYGAILAFVAILAACIFGITKGSLASAIHAAFSAVAVQLNNMSAASGGAS